MCSYFDTTDGYLRFISTVSQTTVPSFILVVIFSGGLKNIAGQTTVPFIPVVILWVVISVRILTQTPIRYGTYNRNKLLPEKKVQSFGRLCFLAGSNYNQKKLRPEKKVQSSGRLCFSNHRKNYDPKKKGTVVWPTVEINLR